MKMTVVKKFLAIGTLAAFAACSSAGGTRSAAVGRPAPNWNKPTSAGTMLSTESLRGRPVYLNFFATWCPPCNEEAPDVNALQKQYASNGLRVIGVDELEDAKKAAQFVRKFNLVYPAVVDDDGTLQSAYDVNGLPVHVFIDRSGVIRKIVRGEMSKKDIAASIQSIL
jgi:peroxiredoxin